MFKIFSRFSEQGLKYSSLCTRLQIILKHLYSTKFLLKEGISLRCCKKSKWA